MGDTLRLNVCKIGRQSTPAYAVWGASGVTFLVSQPEDTIYTTWGIDGATVSEFTLDVTGTVEIDANDVDGSTQKTRLGAWYSYILTTENGIRYLYGAISFLASNSIKINVDVLDLKIENINASTALYFSDLDVRLFRSDGTTIIAPTSYSIHNDYTGVPDVVETGVSGLTAGESNQLFAIPTNVSTQVQAGLDSQGYSAARAIKLDNLDATVSSASGGLTLEENTKLMAIPSTTLTTDERSHLLALVNGMTATQEAKLDAIPTTQLSAIDVWAVEGEVGYTVKDMLKITSSALAGEASGLEGTTPTFKSIDGSKTRITGNYNAGTRTTTLDIA